MRCVAPCCAQEQHAKRCPFRRKGEAQLSGQHLNVGGVAQGGLLATVADFSLGRAIRAGRDDDQQPATVSLTTDYLGPAKEGDWLESTTRVERVAERMAFADCSLRVDGREIVRARAVFAAVS